MGGECNLLLSDHELLILCFTGHPFPVWIWTSDDAAEEEMEKAYQMVKENNLLSGKHHFNIKYSLAEYFIRRAAEEGSEMKIITNMFAYDCLDPVRPDTEADGGIYCCEMKDLEELVDFLDRFHKELSIDQKDISGYREDAEEFIRTGNMYLWKDEQGRNVASCKYAPDGDIQL